MVWVFFSNLREVMQRDLAIEVTKGKAEPFYKKSHCLQFLVAEVSRAMEEEILFLIACKLDFLIAEFLKSEVF